MTTDNVVPTEPVGPPTAASEQTEPEATTDDTTEPGSNAEAARYRRELRAAEVERDGLRDTVDRLRRREVEGLAERVHHLAKPSALWALADAQVSDLLDDQGEIDPEKVAGMVDQAISTLGLATRRRLPQSPNAGLQPSNDGDTASWGSFLKGATGRQ